MMLSTRGRYAVMAMVELAVRDREQPVTLAAISESQEIPLAYLEQIFAKLRKAGLVHSVRGPGGGYHLAKSPSELTIACIVIASEEAIRMTRCNPENKMHGCMAQKTRCMTHDLWDGLSSQIYDYLQALTLEDVVARRIYEKFPHMTVSVPDALAVDFLLEESSLT
jgi:Rrf2 family transcriptional regulator, iron-sulfur cluster assembly transcription factor